MSRVKYAEIDQASGSLTVNIDGKNDDNRIKIKLFLNTSTEEMTPTVQYDGISLIKQNVEFDC